MEKSFFQLKNASDLLKKLRWEYENIKGHPGNAWHAYNFFVTAEHMAEWMNLEIAEIRRASDLLRICSHLANNGKHFSAKRHNSVVVAEREGVYAEGIYEPDVYKESLVVHLKSEDHHIADGNNQIMVSEISKKLLQYWELRVGKTKD